MWASNVLWCTNCNQAQGPGCKFASVTAFGTRALHGRPFRPISEYLLERDWMPAEQIVMVSGHLPGRGQGQQVPTCIRMAGRSLGQCLRIQVGKHQLKSLCQSRGISAVWRNTTMQRLTWDLGSMRGFFWAWGRNRHLQNSCLDCQKRPALHWRKTVSGSKTWLGLVSRKVTRSFQRSSTSCKRFAF